MEAVRELPDDVTWEDAGERLRLAIDIAESREQLRRGEGMSSEEVRASLRQWLTE